MPSSCDIRAAAEDDFAAKAGEAPDGTPRWVVGLTLEEFEEIVALIDDDPVDEFLLRRIRKRLLKKVKAIRNGLNPVPPP